MDTETGRLPRDDRSLDFCSATKAIQSVHPKDRRRTARRSRESYAAAADLYLARLPLAAEEGSVQPTLSRVTAIAACST